jgi:hypothetical protein
MKRPATILLAVLLLLLPAPPAAAERSFTEAKAALAKGLRASDPGERANAVYELDGFDTPDAVRVLARAVLNREDRARVIVAALQLLGAVRAEDSLKALVREAAKGGWLKRARSIEALGKTRSEVAFDAVLAAAYDEDTRIRVSALVALENFQDGRADLALIDALEAPEWPVRAAAVTALRRRDTESAVPALIARLGPEGEDGRLRGDVAHALGSITHKKFGVDRDAWQTWYNEQKGTGPGEKPAPSVVPLPTGRMAGVRTFARRIVFVLGVHKSMQDPVMKRGAAAAPADVRAKGGAELAPWLAAETKIDVARLWIEWAIQNLSPDVSFNIVTYGASANAAFSDFEPATPMNKTKGIRRVASLSAGGNANFYSGLEKAFKLVSKDPVDLESMLRGPEVVFFLSDGSSDYGEIKEAYRAFEEAERWNRYRQIQFHCIGVGQHDSRVLGELANLGPGGALASVP